MSAHERALARRREALQARSRALRGELAVEAAPWSLRLARADRLLAVDRWDLVRMVITAASTLLVVRRTRLVLKVAVRVLAWYPLVRPLIARFWRR